MAVQILTDSGYLGYPLMKEPTWSSDFTLAAVFIGSVLGMTTMGVLGDLVGRARTMRLTLCLTVLGALIPAAAFGNDASYYCIIFIGRCVLGVGFGGTFTLAAVSASECSVTDAERLPDVGCVLVWLVSGLSLPYVVSIVLLAGIHPSPPQEWAPQVQFRLLLALGAVPASFAYFSLPSEPSHDVQAQLTLQQSEERGASGLRVALQNDPLTKKHLIGTTLTWFFFDIAFYGNAVFTPIIAKKICMTGRKLESGCEQSLLDTAMQSLIISSCSIPACFISVKLVGRTGVKAQTVLGLAIVAVLSAAMGIACSVDSENETLIFPLFCALTFSLGAGPCVGTYVMPTFCFPSHIRATCHGVSAAGGKIGALVGALIFPIVSKSTAGLPGVLFIECGACCLGVLVGAICLPSAW
eukprot:TRINITY_DN36946_c0_g1_i1.p1 TRINITY_DN36946_c0_g1~~TRINITY_DN36946_c0_g1_i1.p1  ORF type:complete len:463 (-),score=51.36 TRINITY_DN36946_c0_g1_i1:86-1318(-)